MAVYDSLGRREVKASKAYTCINCGGTIDRYEKYINFHTDKVKGNWQGRMHIDCNAAWWQGDLTHLLSALALLSKHGQTIEEINPELVGLPVAVTCTSPAGNLQHFFSDDFAKHILQAPDLAVRGEALEQISRALALFAQVLMTSCGDPKISQQVSHFMQQTAQVTDIEPYRL